MPKIIPISFGGNGPDRANVKELGDHHGAGDEDHAAGVCRRPSPRAGSRLRYQCSFLF